MEDGATLRTHLQRLAYSTQRIDPRLDAPPIAESVRGLWEMFLQLSATRRSGMTAHPFTMVDIEAYCRMTGVRLTEWELETLIALDTVALNAAAKNRKPS